MNVRFLAFAALAASMALVSCNKETAPEQPGVPKSVTIKLANVVPGTKNAGGDQIAEGTAVVLNSFQVFFSDGTNLYKAKNADNATEATQYFGGADVSGNLEGSYHFLPSAVNKVIVIGNHNQIYASTEAELNLALEIENEQNADALTLYDEKGLTPVAGDDHSGDHSDGGASAVFTADLKLTPRIARLFIKDFTYTYKTDGSEYKTLDLKKLAINDYYGGITLADETGSDWQSAAISDATVWDWLAGLTAGWNCDDLTTISLTPASANTPVTKESKHYYHFFVADGLEPQLVLQCESDGMPLYLATSGFKLDGGEVTWENGYIYEMSFAFSDEDLTSPDKCVDITVTPVEWQVEVITPEF